MAQGCVQAGFNISKGRDTTSSLGNPFLYLTTLTINPLLLLFRIISMYLGLCQLPLVLSLNTTEKFGSFYLTKLPRYLYTWRRSLWAFSSPGWTLTALSACPHVTDVPVTSSPSYFPRGLTPVYPCLSCMRQPSTGHSTQMCLTLTEYRGRTASFDSLAMVS